MAEEVIPGSTVPVSSAVDPNTVRQQVQFYNGQLADVLPAVDTQANLVKEFGQNVNGGAGELSNGDLPWSTVAMPVTAAGVGGIGHNQHALQPGSWVLGYFADGDDCQQYIVTHTLMGGPGAGSTGTTGSSSTGSGGSDGDFSNVGETANFTGNQRVEFAYKKLQSLGYSKVQAAGILGNLMNEGGKNLNTGSVGDGGSAKGIAQWHPDRWSRLVNYANNKKRSPYDLEIQLEFVDVELKSSESRAMRLLQNATTPGDAARAMVAYERPGGYNPHRPGFDGANGVPNVKQRMSDAIAVYNKYQNSAMTTTNNFKGGGN